MAEPPSKRQRNDHHPHTKKQRPYEDMILSLLEDDEDVPTSQDLSSFITYLQREIDDPADLSASSSSSSLPNKLEANESVEEEQEDRERVMRRLLEASDDELGLPSRDEGSEEFGWGEGVLCDGLWEIEHLLLPEEEEEELLL